MDNQQGPTVYTGNSAQSRVAAWVGGEFEGDWIHVYVWPSPFAVHLKLSQPCSSAAPQYKIKFTEKQASDWIWPTTDVEHKAFVQSLQLGEKSSPFTLWLEANTGQYCL